MKKYCLDKGWSFHDGDIPRPVLNSHTQTYMAAKAGGRIGAASPDYDKSGWETVDLPHDYAVKNEFEEKYGPANGYKKRGKAWYSKRFRLDGSDRDKQILFEFEGITGESVVYLNGSVIARNYSGYNTFTADGTDMALYGENVNDLVISVDADLIEGWWYEGAGIYRHVNMYKKNMLHFEHDGVFLEPVKLDASTWQVFSHMTVENNSTVDRNFEIEILLYNKDDDIVGKYNGEFSINAGDIKTFEGSFLTYSPNLWDIDDPYLYRAVCVIKEDGQEIDDTEFNIGFRTIKVDADNGFMLNGRRVQLLGTCNHQDHAGVGVAVPDAVNEYRIKLLKELGSNAYRAAHGNCSRSILDACDKYGILMMDENRQYNSAECDGLKQIRDMVKRDRNHPCVIMYSLFNEEPLQGTYSGRKLAIRMKNEVEKYDGTRFTLGAMNNGLLSDSGANDVCDIAGINYQTYMYDTFREKFSYLPVVGSENCSAFMTRGCFKTDHDKHIIDNFDSEAAPWGNTYRDGWKQIIQRPYMMGYFIWTGFDYRGEPTPYAYPSISTQFGIMDTCGFPKSAYYLNKSYWTDKELVHIASHWNYSDGETVDIHVFSNAKKVELIINGRSVSELEVDDENTAVFKDILFESGYISVRSLSSDASDTVYTCGETAALELSSGMETAYENDGICVNVKALDLNGHYVYNACELIRFSVSGGSILGVGNGDPNSHEPDKASERKLYMGLCQAVISPDSGATEMPVTAVSESGIQSQIIIPVAKRENECEYISSVTEKYLVKWRQMLDISNEYPDVEKEISDSDMNTWVVTSVGNGYDDTHNGAVGHVMYRTKTEAKAGQKLIFRELFGDMVDVYINNEKVMSCECPYGKRFVYDIKDSGELKLDVVIESRVPANVGGISKPVIITD